MSTYFERFWNRVEKTESCWNWTGHVSKKGYGRSGIGHEWIKTRAAHRASYEMKNGPLPGGLQIDHLCHNRRCVRPDHLRATTNKQNSEHKPIESSAKSGYRGVSYRAEREKWRGTVVHNGKTFYAGHFDTPEQARDAVMALRNRLFTHNDDDR